MIDLKHLRALESSAAPGPWKVSSELFDGEGVAATVESTSLQKTGDYSFLVRLDTELEYHQKAKEHRAFADAAFIAESRNAMSELLDELELARAVVENARKATCWQTKESLGIAAYDAHVKR
jgi:hypothetical protein